MVSRFPQRGKRRSDLGRRQCEWQSRDAREVSKGKLPEHGETVALCTPLKERSEQAWELIEVGLSVGHVKAEVSSGFVLSTRDATHKVGRGHSWKFGESAPSRRRRTFEDPLEEVGGI